MRARYGSYLFEVNETAIMATSRVELNDAGVPASRISEFELEGRLYGNGQADISNRMAVLILSLQTPYQDLVLLRDDGGLSATILVNAGSISGVVCMEGPDFLNNVGAEYATQRTFRAKFSAEYPLLPGNRLLSWTEKISFIGNGGPRRVVLPALNGPPQEQITYSRTPYKAKQTGMAVGYLVPVPDSAALPFAPSALMNETAMIERTSPERKGPLAINQKFALTWSFDFISATKMTGIPRPWPVGL